MKTMFFIFFISANFAFAQNSKELSKVFEHFTKGYYADALEEIDLLKEKHPKSGVLFYWEGLCFKKMQEYEDAHLLITKARKLGYKNKELFYEHGQALYALKKNRRALGAFAKSVKSGFKVNESKLYIAQLLEEMGQKKKAYKFYKSVGKNGDKALAQAANFRKTKMLHDKAKQLTNPQKAILKQILPYYEDALDIDSKSNVAKQINIEIYKIKQKYGLLPRKLRNGSFIPPRDWDLDLRSKISYDSNVIQQADDVVNGSTNKDSWISENEVSGAYRYNYDDLWIFQPEAKLTHNYHWDRETPTIYTNDKLVFNPGLKTRYEHLILNKKATTNIEVNYTNTRQDFNSKKELEYYTSQWAYSIGEKINVLPIGSTQAKFKIESVRGADNNAALDRTTYVVSFDQVISMKKGILLFLNENRFNIYERAKSSETNSYMLRIDYIYPELFPEINANFNFATTFTNTKLNKETRGLETKIAPGFNLSKKLTKKLRGKLQYGYTRNTSKDKANFQYSQHVYSLEASYSF